MRVVNENYETITNYDLNSGGLYPTVAVKENVDPIDNVTKFAWHDDDYEEVQMYIPNPVKTTAQQITELKAQLSKTDYKVIKCSECQLLGMEMPYDVAELHTERQSIRDQINLLQKEG